MGTPTRAGPSRVFKFVFCFGVTGVCVHGLVAIGGTLLADFGPPAAAVSRHPHDALPAADVAGWFVVAAALSAAGAARWR